MSSPQDAAVVERDNPLAHIGFDPHRHPGAAPAAQARRVRLIAQHRDSFEVHDGHQRFRAKALPRLKSLPPDQRPAVGDFGWVEAQAGEWLLTTLLPRFSVLTRGAAGERYALQTLAVNIDRVLLLCGLDTDFNPRRIERYLGLIGGHGIAISVLLTKADLHPDWVQESRDAVLALAEGLDVHAVNALERASLAPVLAQLGPGRTAVLVGSSGVGKSTLTNTLIGDQRYATRAVRASDGRGRHTTVHRQLVELPEGGCLIDTPGLREIKLVGHEELDQSVFTEIAELAAGCRFRDCSHQSEPGCAVQAAVEQDALDAGRYASYLKLKGEQAAQQAMATGARRLSDRRGSLQLRAALKAKGRPD